VFVGGSFRSTREALEHRFDLLPPRDVLDAICAVVRAEGLESVLAFDFVVENNHRDLHDVTLNLLHSFAAAVFELSEFSGALMEIERTADYGTRVLVVYHDPNGRASWRTTAMLRSFVAKHADAIQLAGYADASVALGVHVRDWIANLRRSGYVA
jgi:hypothetical protein